MFIQIVGKNILSFKIMIGCITINNILFYKENDKNKVNILLAFDDA